MNIIRYLIRPKYNIENKQIDIEEQLGLIIVYFAICVFLTVFIKQFHHIHRIQSVQNLSILKKFLLIVILGPVFEELVCRLWLKEAKFNIVISQSICVVFLVYALYKNSNVFINEMIIITSLVSIVFILEKCIKNFFQRYFMFIFYLSSVVFGLMHVLNFIGIENLFEALVCTSPQIVLGIVLGYIRMNYGFKYGLLFHSFINLSVVLLHALL